MGDRLVFVTIEWLGAQGREAEAFGPWEIREHGSHTSQVSEFIKRWYVAEDRDDVSAKVWAVTSPEAYDQRVRDRG